MTIQETAAACVLAQQMFEAWRAAYETTPDAWIDLTPSSKRQWVERSQQLMDEMRPPANAAKAEADYFAMAASLARRQFSGNVVGFISPSAPYGEARSDDEGAA